MLPVQEKDYFLSVGMSAQTCEDEFKPTEPLLPMQIMGMVNSSSEN